MSPFNRFFLLLPLHALAAVELEVRMADPRGLPIVGGEVVCEMIPALSANPWVEVAARRRVSALTDSAGLARVSGTHAPSQLAVTGHAPGYYGSTRLVAAGDRRASLCLFPQGARVASSRVELLTEDLPGDGVGRAFDLELGAFLPPLGVGRHADVMISGRCESRALPAGSRAAFRDHAEIRFVTDGSGCAPTPRSGQEGFAASVSPGLAGQLLHGIFHPLSAPTEGYLSSLSYVLERPQEPVGKVEGLRPAFSQGIPASPGRIGSPQWIFRIRSGPAALHGVITDFGWVEGGRLRLRYTISAEPGVLSLEFDSPRR